MMKFIEKVGNIQVFVRENAPAIETLFLQLDIVTLRWLYQNVPADRITRLSLNTYKMDGENYFCRIDDTKYFRHYCKPADEFIRDKNGKRIIDR